MFVDIVLSCTNKPPTADGILPGFSLSLDLLRNFGRIIIYTVYVTWSNRRARYIVEINKRYNLCITHPLLAIAYPIQQ